jgi:hypothetical protein
MSTVFFSVFSHQTVDPDADPELDPDPYSDPDSFEMLDPYRDPQHCPKD